VSWIWGFVCDEGPKTDEFIRVYHDPEWKTYITRIPHDQPLGAVEDELDERVAYLASQLRDGFESIQQQLGVKVTDEKLLEALGIWQKYNKKVAELFHLMACDPQPLSGLIGALLSEPTAYPWNTGLEFMENALDISIDEVKQRVAHREGILPEGAPKLMVYSMPTALPWISKMFEQNGVGLTFAVNRLPTKKQLSPSRFDDPYMAAAESWLRRTLTVNIGYKAYIICELMEQYAIDGLVLGFFDFDRWLGSDNKLLARIIEEKTGKPVFYIEGDIWDDRDYSSGALRTRIETIAEIVKTRKRKG
jgi:benzoyl-CoA reductase/2-hydroxyglutaryl-CoA dehydratase subunit BcrC/BadD/HgdB